MSVYYNENDPFAASWLRELIKSNLIAKGDVDERSIKEVQPADLKGYTQCHFFAGIGVWSYSLRNAGWSDGREVWTGSCPCQPFSAAGKKGGFDDARHLWPDWFRLISECRPTTIFGEQVAASNVVGRPGDENMLRLWERQANLFILKNWMEENISNGVLGLPQCCCEGMVCGSAVIDGVESKQAGCGGEGEGNGSRITIRFDSGLGTRTFESREMRSDGDTIRHENSTRMEYPLTGQDDSKRRIHESKLAYDFICLECGLRKLGREHPSAYRFRDSEQAKNEVSAAIESTSGQIKEENGCSWFGSVQTDLEGEGYAVGAVDSCAAGVGAPHIRQRLYFVGHSAKEGLSLRASETIPREETRGQRQRSSHAGGVAVSDGGNSGELANAEHGRCEESKISIRQPRQIEATSIKRRPTYWDACDWLPCIDGKARPVESGTFPLAHGAPNRVGRLRGYGNSLVAPQAQAFIESFMEIKK